MGRLLGALALIVLCVVAIGVVGSGVNTVVPHTTQGEEIRMIQPSGWWLSRDAYAAQEVNVPNSEANKNNGDMHLANAQAELAIAKADALRQEAARLNNAQYKQGQTSGTIFGGIFGIAMGVVGVIGLLAIFAFFATRGTG